MKILSFCVQKKEFLPIEVEVTTLPGLPIMQIIGLPDQGIKESSLKIKSAMKLQGFRWPKSQQIIVNLKGQSDLKKKSSGVELAIVFAILLRTGQLDSSLLIADNKNKNNQGKLLEKAIFLHGELGLDGKVQPMDEIFFDFSEFSNSNCVLITGSARVKEELIPHFFLSQLNDFNEVLLKIKKEVFSVLLVNKNLEASNYETKKSLEANFFKQKGIYIKPPWERVKKGLIFTEQDSLLLKIVSLGRHSLLLMGPRGLGKTTLAEVISLLCEPPTKESFSLQKKYFHFNSQQFWRPLVKPHHSISPLALVGGGVQVMPGEITRAHEGILFLDELLEFSPKCQEALREPMEEKRIHLARGNIYQSFPCDFQMIATTNLCPCGQWLPEKKTECFYSAKKCHHYREKLSGPMVDRFDILYFVKERNVNQKMVPLLQVHEEIERLREQGVAQKEIEFDIENLTESSRQLFKCELNSLRRQNATIQLSKTICLINGRKCVENKDFLLALDYTWKPFLDLNI